MFLRLPLPQIIPIIIFILSWALYVNNIPMFEASDEAEHFLYVHTLAETGELPVIRSGAELNEVQSVIDRWNNQSHHAPLYYRLAAWLVAHTNRSDVASYLITNDLIFTRGTVEHNANKWLHPPTPTSDETPRAIWMLRFANALIGCITLCVVYRIAHWLSKKHTIAIAAMLFCATLPTFIAIHSGVTNDPLLNLLYAFGVLQCLRLLYIKHIRWQHGAVLGLTLALTALTKLTGLSLGLVIIATFGLLLLRRRITRLETAQLLTLVCTIFVMLAGWWYIRNLQLYGDLFATSATQSVWGRTMPITFEGLLVEMQRIALSFWAMVGYLHQPVFAPDMYYVVIGILIGIATTGIVIYIRRNYKHIHVQDNLLVSAVVVFVVVVMLAYGTLSVDISYGRLLFPMLPILASWVAMGWHVVLRQWAMLLILPMWVGAIYFALVTLPASYPHLYAVDSVSQTATFTEWDAEGLQIIGIEPKLTTLQSTDTFLVDVYVQGNHLANLALRLVLIDSVTGNRLGFTEIYPGMAPTNALDLNQIYRATIPITTVQAARLSPRQMLLNLAWYNVAETSEYPPSSTIPIGIFIGADYEVPQVPHNVAIRFGEQIDLNGYQIQPPTANAGDEIMIDLWWEPNTRMQEDWALTMQLFSEDGILVAQSDGDIAGYPTSKWLPDIAFVGTRSLALPPDIAEGTYHLHIGWYRRSDFYRLPVIGGESQDRLYIMPQAIHVTNN